MFSKIEVIGIAVAIMVMALALYLINKPAVTPAATSIVVDQTDFIYVSDDGDSEANLKSALVKAADASGNITQLVVDDVTIGDGAEVKSGDAVVVHYVGTLQNGQEFDSSMKRGQPFSFTVGEGRVIAGWEKGIIGMKEGGKRILIIPADLAYGADGYGPIPGGATLIFSLELMSISK